MNESIGSAKERSPAQRRARHTHTAWAQAGVGLIEVLIAVLVVSVAFLGIAAMQAMSLSTNNGAMARSMATISSYSILDAMRADLAKAKGGAYNLTTAMTADQCPAGGGAFAASQLNQWCKQLADSFGPVATTTGLINCSGTGDCTITISFNDVRAGADGNKKQTVVTRAIL